MPTSESLGELYDDREPALTGDQPISHRPAGMPLSMGAKNRGAQAEARRFAQAAQQQVRSVPAPPPAEQASAPVAGDSGSKNLQRALQGFKLALPFVQKLLPMLEGQVGAAVASLLAPPQQVAPSQSKPAAPPPVKAVVPQQVTIDLAPVEEGLRRLQNGQRELHVQITEQNTSIKRVEDQLGMVREATDRNTLEQQELMEDLKGIGKKVNVVTLVMLSMLLGSLLLNLILYLHMQRVLP